jgi:hypothetical protein
MELPDLRCQEMVAYGLFLGLIALIVVLAFLRREKDDHSDDTEKPIG